MIKSWSILLLSAYLALQLVAAYPHRRAAADEEPSAAVQSADVGSTSNENELSLPRNQLLFGTLDLLSNQSRFILRDSNTFLKDLINEMKALPEKSKAIEQNITRVSDVVRDIDNIDLNADPPLIDEMFSAVDEVGKIYDEFYGMPENEDPKSDAAILEQIFEKIGSESLEKRFNDSMEATLNDFIKLFDNFETSLGAEGKQDEVKLINWYESFKKAEDIENKFGLLEEFWTFFK